MLLTILPDQVAPSITKSWPIDGTAVYFGTPVLVGANVSDNVQVASVQISIDGGAPTNLTSAPYQVSYSGKQVNTVTTVPVVIDAFDPSGNKTTVSFGLLAYPPADPNGPQVAISCPGSGVFVPPGYSLPVSVSATAVGGRSVSKVEFYVGSASTPSSTVTSPTNGLYTGTCPIPSSTPDGGTVLIRVRAVDSGNLENSIVLSVPVRTGQVFSVSASIGAGVTTYDNQMIFVTGGTLTIDGHHAFSGMAVLPGASVTHSAATGSSAKSLDMDFGTGTLCITCNATIDVSGRGYPSGYSYPSVIPLPGG